MDDIKAKQQIVEKIKSSTSILVTVSNNPSVDALSAALGLTLLLDKLEKHPTAIFSGEVPPAITFLEPEKTFDNTTDSLRDFIIALDKEKADHLRYKVEGDSVKIFITPYKTTITSDDLNFSQGDYNVELVIALGVDVQEHLDNALESHGQIFHDAAIITVTAGDQVSNLGGIDWHDTQASSLSEMIAGLAEALKTDKTKSLLDAEISSAFLTGIVAETDRFSNSHTSSRVMTVAAQLMGAGADQQLIASKLEASHEIGNGNLDVGNETVEEAPKEPEHKDSLSISHKSGETLEELDKRVKAAEAVEATEAANESLSEHTSNANAAGAYAPDNDEAPKEEAPAPEVVETPAPAPVSTPEPSVGPSYASEQAIEPSLGGTLNATTEQAAEDAQREVENDQNKTILSHAYVSSGSAAETPSSATGSGAASYVLGHDEAVEEAEPTAAYAEPAPEAGTFGHELVIEPLASTTAAPAPVASTPADLGLPMPPELPDFSAPPAMAPAYALDTPPAAQPEILGDILAPEPIAPATPPVAPSAPTPAPLAPPVAPAPNDPGQFKIPGQQ
jgi:nanoRNase/pAp phosphatase (c-di-AMP/oligoRNAs hydrolase)